MSFARESRTGFISAKSKTKGELKTMINCRCIGIDVGYGYTKIVTDNGNGLITPITFRSVVGTYEDGIQVEGLKSSTKEIVTVSNQRFLVGSSALKHSNRILNGREKGWINSIAYTVLLKYALQVIEANSVDLTITTGLPVNYYKSDKEKLTNLIRDLAQDYCINLTVKVIPQPLGSFFNLLFGSNSTIATPGLSSEKVGVLDIGFYTTDLITVHELEIVDKQIDSFENGISTALDAISKDIEDTYGMRPDLYKTEQAVKQGYVKAFGAEKDIRFIAQQRLTELAQEITAKAKTIWKSAADIDRVVLTGGGASLLKSYLNLYQHATVIEDAQFANSMGYYKLAKRIYAGGGGA
ncbi:MAG: ParM/StbA family protein [Nitrospirota bacterium]